MNHYEIDMMPGVSESKHVNGVVMNVLVRFGTVDKKKDSG